MCVLLKLALHWHSVFWNSLIIIRKKKNIPRQELIDFYFLVLGTMEKKDKSSPKPSPNLFDNAAASSLLGE